MVATMSSTSSAVDVEVDQAGASLVDPAIRSPFMPLPESAGAEGNQGYIIPSHICEWFKIGKSDSEVLDILRKVPGAEATYDLRAYVNISRDKFISDLQLMQEDLKVLEQSWQLDRDLAEEHAAFHQESKEELPIEENLPPFPAFKGLLHDLATALFPDIPYEFKIMAAVTHWGLVRSGMDSLAGEPNFQTRFYTCLIGQPGLGKTAAINEIRNWMAAFRPSSMRISHSVDSGPALVDEFGDLQKSFPAAERFRVLLDVDEMRDLFEKSKVTAQSRNSLTSELLTLFESNITGNRARHANKGQRTQVENAHLAILGGATQEGYVNMWTGTGGSATGLQSRFIPITTSNGQMPITPRPSDLQTIQAVVLKLQYLSEKPGQVISLTSDARQALVAWWDQYEPWDKPSISRVDGFVKRLLIVLAVTNGVTEVGLDLVDVATKLGDYVIAVREKFNPVDSYSWTQAFENSILDIFKKRSGQAFTMNDIRRFIRPDKKPGGLQAFQQAWRTCISVEYLKQAGISRKGVMRYRFEE